MNQSPASSSISQYSATSTCSSSFRVIFEKALKAYKINTKQDLLNHPFASQLQACDSPAAILTILQEQVHQFEQSRSGDERLRRWLNPTINVLYAFSAAVGQGIGLVFSPANVIFAGAGVLLLAAKDVESSQDLLIDVFERVENFFRRLEIYADVPPTPAMTEMMVKIMIEVLDILGTATKEMKESRTRKFLKKLAGIRKLEDGLNRLDKMTNEEARMANAEVLRVTRNTHKKVEEVDTNVQGVVTQVKGVDENVRGVRVEVQGVNENVKLVKEQVQMVIDAGKESATEAKLAMQQIASNVDDVNRRQMRENLRKWQSPSDPSTNHNIVCSLQHKGTAEWFCDGTTFEEWVATSSLLWIHGKPGSGKSVLCSAIIQKITALCEAGSASMAYFYFDFRDVDKRSRHHLLSSLLVQLFAHSDPFCDVLSRLYEAHNDGARQPSDDALIRCLRDMLTLPDQGPVYLILDALDECPNTSGVPSFREQVLEFVNNLVDLQLPSLHICVTSRPEIDIQDSLGKLASHSVSLHDESGQKKDIAEYVESVVHSNSVRAIRRWRDADKDLVIRTLSERADGMFRWVFCQLETLRHCLPQNIPRALRELPASLDETYERVLKEIVLANRNHAYRLLQCLTVASRPLRVQELAEILALDFDGTKGIPELKEEWRWKDRQEAVLSTCSSLIAVVDDGHHRVVQFSHFSVKEFLTSDRLATSSTEISHFHIPPEPAHIVIVKACLGILLQPPADNGGGGGGTGSDSPLAEYAAAHWVGHAQFGKVSTSVEDGMRRLFDLEKPHFAAWLNLYDIDTRWNNFTGHYSFQPGHRGFPLYYSSLCGFRDLATYLVAKHPQHVNVTLGQCLTPLVAALHKGHFDIAELLFQRGADVGIRGDNRRSPLHAASVEGSVDIAQWLLGHGAVVDSRGFGREVPLHLAALNGRVEIVRMLINHGTIVDAKNEQDHTPLHLASEGGHPETVRLLLQHGADVNTQGLRHRTPLHLASFWYRSHTSGYRHEGGSNGKAEAVRVLLAYGADVTTRDDTRSTPLHLALSKGPPEVPRLLIEHGADVNALDGNRMTPLHLASSRGDINTVRLLIEHGADVNVQDGIHSTPLHLVSSYGPPEIPRLLIEGGADVNALDGHRKTPLHLASSRGRTKITQLLIEHGADVNAQDQDRSTPLHLASSRGRTKTMQLLIRHGAGVNVRDADRSMPLHLALLSWSPESIRLLIEHGADVNARDESNETPLHLAVYQDQRYLARPPPVQSTERAEIVQVLIRHGADVNASDETHSTPLHLASSKGCVESVKLLIQHGAGVNAKNGRQSTPLHLAVSTHSDLKGDLVRLLLSHGADVGSKDARGQTPLDIASSRGLSKIADLMLVM